MSAAVDGQLLAAQLELHRAIDKIAAAARETRDGYPASAALSLALAGSAIAEAGVRLQAAIEESNGEAQVRRLLRVGARCHCGSRLTAEGCTNADCGDWRGPVAVA